MPVPDLPDELWTIILSKIEQDSPPGRKALFIAFKVSKLLNGLAREEIAHEQSSLLYKLFYMPYYDKPRVRISLKESYRRKLFRGRVYNLAVIAVWKPAGAIRVEVRIGERSSMILNPWEYHLHEVLEGREYVI